MIVREFAQPQTRLDQFFHPLPAGDIPCRAQHAADGFMGAFREHRRLDDLHPAPPLFAHDRPVPDVHPAGGHDLCVAFRVLLGITGRKKVRVPFSDDLIFRSAQKSAEGRVDLAVDRVAVLQHQKIRCGGQDRLQDGTLGGEIFPLLGQFTVQQRIGFGEPDADEAQVDHRKCGNL